MIDMFRGHRPDVTPAQVAAVLVAGVPAVATLLSAFGVTTLTQAEQDSLSSVLAWGGVLAGLLIGGDATLRTARNVADAKRDTAAMQAGSLGGPSARSTADAHDPEADEAEGAVLVADEDEFAMDDDAAAVNGHGEFDDPDLLAVQQ